MKAMPWQELDAKIREIYARLPKIECKGLCHTYCTNIDMTTREREVIRRKHGVTIRRNGAAHKPKQSCQALDVVTNRCSVYEDRPLICRAWGVQESMDCPYGCKPERYLSDEEFFYISHELKMIAGDDLFTPEELLAIVAQYETPEGRALYDQLQRSAREQDAKWRRMHFGLHPELAPQEDDEDVKKGTQPEHQQEAHSGS